MCCVDAQILDLPAQCVWAPPLMKVLRYSALNELKHSQWNIGGFLTGTVTCIFGVSLSEPHTTVVYRNTCIVRPTDQLCPSHSCDTDTFHVPMLPRPATLMCVVTTRPRTPTMRKWKAETPAQQTARLERETSEPLHTCTSLSMSPSLAFMYEFFSLVISHKSFSTFFLHDSSTKTAYTPHMRNLQVWLGLFPNLWVGPGDEAIFLEWLWLSGN